MEIEVDCLVLAHELPTRPDGPTVLAYATLLVGGALIVNDVRLIRLADGRQILAMPDRPCKVSCVHCRRRVGRRWSFCPGCGGDLPDFGPAVDEAGRETYFADVVYPTSNILRREIESIVRRAYANAARAEYEAEMAARDGRARMREAAGAEPAARCGVPNGPVADAVVA